MKLFNDMQIIEVKNYYNQNSLITIILYELWIIFTNIYVEKFENQFDFLLFELY